MIWRGTVAATEAEMTKSKTRSTAKSIYEGLGDSYDALDDEIQDRLANVKVDTHREDNSFSYEYGGGSGYHEQIAYYADSDSDGETFEIQHTLKEPIDEDEMNVEGWDPIVEDCRSAARACAKMIDLTQVENEDGTFTVTYTFEIGVVVDEYRLKDEYDEARYFARR